VLVSPRIHNGARNSRDQENVTKTGSVEAKKSRRWLQAAVDVAAAAMIATGALLTGISVSQHQQHDHALALQAGRKAQIDRAAAVEAQQFLTTPLALADQSRLITQIYREHSARAQPLPATAGVAGDHRVVPAPARQRSSPSGPERARPHRATVSEVGGAGATLVIPALQVRAPIVATGAVDGFMTIPADIHTVGWYDGVNRTGASTTSASAPWPGQPGVSLLAGHVDWAGEGPGALYYIGQLVIGDPIAVIGSNGETTNWRVSQAPIILPKAELPADLFVNVGPPKLALVTCGGPFDAATRHYLDNVIVWATLAER
jgi:hypothetical protein